MLYAVVPVYNEATLLPTCLDSLLWLDKVFVIDGRYKGHAGNTPLSSDGTREIITGGGDKP